MYEIYENCEYILNWENLRKKEKHSSVTTDLKSNDQIYQLLKKAGINVYIMLGFSRYAHTVGARHVFGLTLEMHDSF